MANTQNITEKAKSAYEGFIFSMDDAPYYLLLIAALLRFFHELFTASQWMWGSNTGFLSWVSTLAIVAALIWLFTLDESDSPRKILFIVSAGLVFFFALRWSFGDYALFVLASLGGSLWLLLLACMVGNNKHPELSVLFYVMWACALVVFIVAILPTVLSVFLPFWVVLAAKFAEALGLAAAAALLLLSAKSVSGTQVQGSAVTQQAPIVSTTAPVKIASNVKSDTSTIRNCDKCSEAARPNADYCANCGAELHH